MNKLKHDNIIELEEIYEGDNNFYLVLEYLKGKNLHDYIHKSKAKGISFEDI
jgi:serine/threonine protein kinase